LIYPLLDQKNRAERVASLDFVDYIVISPHGAQSSIVLESINPEFLLMQQDNTFFLKGIIEVVNNKFPGIKILVSNVPKDIKLPVLSMDKKNKKYSNKIANRLLELAKDSDAPVGKISAVLVLDNVIVSEASNSISGEHAEEIILKNKKYYDESYVLYILIPPCPMCAKAILASGIKKVSYLFDYGDSYGTEILKDAGVFINIMKE